MSPSVKAWSAVVGLPILVASVLLCLHLGSTVLYATSPLHSIISPIGLPTDELALDVQCPSILTWSETANIHATISNLTSRTLDIRVLVSERDFTVTGAGTDIRRTISPGETIGLYWLIKARQPAGGSFSIYIHSPGSGVTCYSLQCVVPVFLVPKGIVKQAPWIGLLGTLLGSVLCVPWVYQWLRGGRARVLSITVVSIVLLGIAVSVCLTLYVIALDFL